MTESLLELVELESIERLEARPGRERVLQAHMPVLELTDERSARGQWSVLEYDYDGDHGRQRRQHYADVVTDYRKDGGQWRVAARTGTPLRDDSEIGALPEFSHPTSLSEGWLPEPDAPTPAQLVDLEAIRQLKARYFRYLDTQDWSRLRGLFVDDASFEVAGAVPDGADADGFAEAVARNLTGTVTVHHGHLPDIAITGVDTASGIWALNDYVEQTAAARHLPAFAIPGHGIRGYGHYEERYRRERGDWKIAHLRLSYLRLDPLIREPIPQTLRSLVSDQWLPGGGLPDVDRLFDLRAIKRLKARYFELLDAKRWDELRALFTDDARVCATADESEGVDAFVAGVRDRMATARTVHHGHMPEIRFISDTTARGIWATFEYLELPADQAGIISYGHHEEEYRRDAGEWRIASMRQRRLRVDPLPTGRPVEASVASTP
jgi:hypothetical protein